LKAVDTQKDTTVGTDSPDPEGSLTESNLGKKLLKSNLGERGTLSNFDTTPAFPCEEESISMM